jgi:carboxyl-terminal processing protease
MRRVAVGLIGLAALSVPLYAAVEQAPPRDDGPSFALFARVFGRIKSGYVEPVTDDKLVEAAISGMLTSLDPHSSYLNEQEYQELQEQTEGEFGGVGAEITQENGRVRIVSPIDDTPASRAGLMPGDTIFRVDGQPTAELSLAEVVSRLRGAPRSDVKLTVQREGREPFELTLTRDVIRVQAVKSQLLDDGIGYVRIASFSEQTDAELHAALDRLTRQAGHVLAGLVLDLRNDPGGLLDQAVAVAGDFLDGGEVVSTRGRRGDDHQTYRAEPEGDRLRGVPIVVLINAGTASAAEIVAGALQDHKRALLLGSKSFGKGSVQTIMPLPGGRGAIRLTTARYYTPSGRSIQGKGIDPDIVVAAAKIERIKPASALREADLRHALRNTDKPDSDTGAAAPNASDTPPALTDDVEGDTTDATILGTGADYQLVRAVDLLKGVKAYQASRLGG